MCAGFFKYQSLIYDAFKISYTFAFKAIKIRERKINTQYFHFVYKDFWVEYLILNHKQMFRYNSIG